MAGQLDLIFIKQNPGTTEGTVVATDELVWMGQEKTSIDPDRPVPLIAYQGTSLSRQIAIDALEGAGRTWRITCNTREVNGVLAAVRAGIGVAPFPQSLIPPDLAQLPVMFELPPLGNVDFTLLDNPISAREPVEALSTAIVARQSVMAKVQ